MNIFEGITIQVPKWRVQSERCLTKEEKQHIKTAIVVIGQWGLCLELITRNSINTVPLSTKVDTVIGYIPNIDSIKVLTLEKYGDTITRIEF